MTLLDSAARELVQDTRSKVIDYKNQNKLTQGDIADECEISIQAMRSFLEGHSPSSVTFFKIKLALGF